MTSLLPGLCSVTFRDLSVGRIVELAVQAGIEAIEWGGDVHVPLGDLVAARDAGARCGNVGIECSSYGSYVFAGHAFESDLGRLVETAKALGAPNVRVWCPLGLLPDGAGEDRARVAAQLRRLAGIAADADLTVSLEFHAGTLTQTAKSTLRLIDDVGVPNLFTYWQPIDGVPVPDLLEELRLVLPRLSHLHVFRWDASGTRLPLGAGADLWPDVLQIVLADMSRREGVGAWRRERVAFLEFVESDDPGLLARDARVLRAWLAEVSGG